MYRPSHKTAEKQDANKYEYFHMDLCGPMSVTGIRGVRYFMWLKDENTCFRFLVPNAWYTTETSFKNKVGR
ncbi:unnamed protein product [Ceratitis capitata]|uniref:(Mediterranean fruit fly) hypothetical protein n=1 Tax=Ceratitis capitata TaxID=7213 RepID=A0A811UVY2_CERCA|nr:unnamed protein product [Ceratitis capitata]